MLIVVLIWDILWCGSTFHSHPHLVLSSLLLEMSQQLNYQVVIFCIEKVSLLLCGEAAVLWSHPGVLTVKRWFAAGDGALPSMLHGAPFIILDTCSCIEISTDPCMEKSRTIPRYSCLFPLVLVRGAAFPNSISKSDIISTACQMIVHCELFISLLATHGSFAFRTKCHLIS